MLEQLNLFFVGHFDMSVVTDFKMGDTNLMEQIS